MSKRLILSQPATGPPDFVQVIVWSTMNASFIVDGIVPIIPTPFNDQDGLDPEGYSSLIEFAIRGRASSVCLPAYASEYYKLSETERLEAVRWAVHYASGRIPVIAQVNAVSLRQAIDAAKQAEALGASALNTAVPRIFATSEDDLLRYFERLLSSTSLPYLIQDFNPGGASVSPAFLARLKNSCPNLKYVKLEEPLLAGKVRAILEATNAQVGVLEGWGGMHTLELAPLGTSGVMPSLGLCDFPDRVFRLAKAGKQAEAYPIFSAILPQIVFSLQNPELYHHCEKRLLAARGVSIGPHVRDLRRSLSAHEEAYIDFLNARILDAAGRYLH